MDDIDEDTPQTGKYLLFFFSELYKFIFLS